MKTRRPPWPAVRSASAVWSALSAGARFAARKGWLHSEKLPSRVVSVGNLQAGGAGKTPLVAQIAREAHERGLKVCILCRGYGGDWEHGGGGGLLGPGQQAQAAAICGDEAALLRDLAPQAAIGVGADRVRQYARAVEAFGKIDLVVLDDGFQHWKIKKDLEIVALTSWGPGEILFRDSFEALRSADLLVWTKGDDVPPWPDSKARARIRYRLAPPVGPDPYWLVTGVADAENAVKLARDAGYRIERHVYFPDHARYAEPMVRDLISGAERARAKMAVTGKDWVKWREFGGVGALKGRLIQVLEPELDWLEGREHWNRLLWGQ